MSEPASEALPEYRSPGVEDPKGLQAAHSAWLAEHAPELAAYDPFDMKHLENRNALWSIAQKKAPVFFIPRLGCWAVTTYDLVLRVVQDTQTFTSRHVLNLNPVPDALKPSLPYGWPEGYPSLLNNDPPLHTYVRRLAQDPMRVAEVAKLEPQVRALVNELIDTFIDDGHCDLMEQFARPLPCTVIARVLGVPGDSTTLGKWSDVAVTLSDPTTPEAELCSRGRHLVDLKDFIDTQIEQCRAGQGAGLLRHLVDAREGDAPALTHPQLVSMTAQMLIAGNDTTTHLITNAVMFLNRPPRDVWNRLLSDRSIIPNVVEETLRIKASVPGLYRTTTAEVDLGGVRLPKGATVWVLFGAANHDPAYFPDPTTFDPGRANLGKHLAFGFGHHFCIGTHLAKLESRLALEEFARRLPGMRTVPCQVLHELPSVMAQGVTRLEVEW